MSLVDLGGVPRHATRCTRAEFDAVLYGEKHWFAGATALNELIDCIGAKRRAQLVHEGADFWHTAGLCCRIHRQDLYYCTDEQ